MKLNSREFQKLFNEDSEDFEYEIAKNLEAEKIKHFQQQEKKSDRITYSNHDSKRKFKSR